MQAIFSTRARGLSSSVATLLLVAGCGSRTPLAVDDTAAPSNVAPSARCSTDAGSPGEFAVELYFLVDDSISMNTVDQGSSVSRWSAVSAALRKFVATPSTAGLGAGIGFFPVSRGGSSSCVVSDYEVPTVAVAPLPPVGPRLLAALDAETRTAGTPTATALRGAQRYLRSRQEANPSNVEAVVLVTDGSPRGCNDTVAITSAVAAAASEATPPIKTYVLGVGPNLPELNAIAQAGGTTRAYLAEASGDGLVDALNSIRAHAVFCP